MTILEAIKNRILKCENLRQLDENPNSSRFDYINSIETVEKQKLEECKIWYVGDSDELQNFYTNRELTGNAQEPFYNRNKNNYFWGIAVKEQPIKKVHSGVCNSAIKTTCDIIGMPRISSEKYQNEIDKLSYENNLPELLSEVARPMTLVEGYGCYKPSIIDGKIEFQFYCGEDVKFVYKGNKLVGAIFIDFYDYQNKKYTLFETRRVGKNDLGKEGSIIEYELYRLSDKGDSVNRVELNTIPELDILDPKGQFMEGIKEVFAVPTKYFYNPNNKHYGKSIIAGKIDLLDDIDQCLSQASQTDRVSTPVEYFPIDLLEKDKFGNTKLPSVYNRQFIAKDVMPNGDGESSGDIQTTQPSLNFEQYVNRYNSLISAFLIGFLSPATMGFDVSLKDNADAQREKEKMSIYTATSIKNAETRQIKKLFKFAFMLLEYAKTGAISMENDYEESIDVKYSDFSAPSELTAMKELLPAFSSGAISDEMFVDKVYGDSLSNEAKQKEVEAIKQKRSADDIKLDEFGLETDENDNRADSREEARNQEKAPSNKE